jgi:TetR/AcrR family macrolide resistance operon transcriptional repressor
MWMARTQTVSDDEIFMAAQNVITRRGVHGFTLKDVASEVGLSRAAIILRFQSTHELKVRLMDRMADAFISLLAKLPTAPGGDSLLAVAAFIGGHLGRRESVPSYFANYTANMEERELAAIERRRGAALRAAILTAMPESRIERETAAALFNAHLTGTIMNWVAADDEDSVAFLVYKTKAWLRLAGIPFNAEFSGTATAAATVRKAVSKPASKAASKAAAKPALKPVAQRVSKQLSQAAKPTKPTQRNAKARAR